MMAAGQKTEDSVVRRVGRTLKTYGRLTIPQRLLKRAQRREVVLVIDEMRYVFETDRYGRIYIPPEIRERLANMTSVEIGLSNGELMLRFRRF